jgi:hypothetical protein
MTELPAGVGLVTSGADSAILPDFPRLVHFYSKNA